jgi:hypothetical protein
MPLGVTAASGLPTRRARLSALSVVAGLARQGAACTARHSSCREQAWPGCQRCGDPLERGQASCEPALATLRVARPIGLETPVAAVRRQPAAPTRLQAFGAAAGDGAEAGAAGVGKGLGHQGRGVGPLVQGNRARRQLRRGEEAQALALVVAWPVVQTGWAWAYGCRGPWRERRRGLA